MDDLLKEAIADAKAVRETALENAKIALEEAFTPRLQSMLAKKIQSEIDVDEQDDEMEDDEEEEDDELAMEPDTETKMYRDDDVGDEFSDEEPEVDMDDEEDEDEIPAEGFDESEVIEINGVKYAPIVSEEGEEDVPMEPAPEEESVDDLDLEAILRELEEELEEDDDLEEDYDEAGTGDGLDSSEVKTADEAELAEDLQDSSEIGAGDNKVDADSADSSDVGQGSEEPASADAPAAGHENPEDEEVDDLVEVNGVTYSKVQEQDAEGDVEEEDIDLEEILKALSE